MCDSGLPMWWWQKLDTLAAGQATLVGKVQALRVSVDALAATLDAVLKLEKATMSQIDDLKAAVATLGQSFTTLDAAIQAEIAALKAAVAANDPAAIQAAVTNISDVSSKMATDAAALSASQAPAA